MRWDLARRQRRGGTAASTCCRFCGKGSKVPRVAPSGITDMTCIMTSIFQQMPCLVQFQVANCPR